MKMRREPYKGHWRVLNAAAPVSLKPNKVAAGMSYTLARSLESRPLSIDAGAAVPNYNRDARTLAMRGTIDQIGAVLRMQIVTVKRVRLLKNTSPRGRL